MSRKRAPKPSFSKIRKIAGCIVSTLKYFYSQGELPDNISYYSLLQEIAISPTRESRRVLFKALEFEAEKIALKYDYSPNRTFPDMFKLCGPHTFPLKDMLKESGWRWLPNEKCWGYFISSDDNIVSPSSDFFTFLTETLQWYHILPTTLTWKVGPILLSQFSRKKGTRNPLQYFAVNHFHERCACLIDDGDRVVDPVKYNTGIIDSDGNEIRICRLCRYGKVCCEKAKYKYCVCDRSTQCPDHGRRCVGNHD